MGGGRAGRRPRFRVAVVRWRTAWCGEEVYDTPPGSTADALCRTLVDPVAPWLVLAALPFAVVLFGGFAGIHLGSRRLFLIALTAPFVVVLVAVFAFLALF